MTAEYEKARRLANNTIAEANRHLDSGNITNPKHHQMLTSMIKDATNTINNIDEMENRRMYSDTNMGYGATDRGSNNYSRNANNATNAMRSMMDTIGKILPQISDNARSDAYDDYSDYDDMEARRGGARKRGRSGRFVRSDYNDDYSDNARSESDHERHMRNEVVRTAAEAAANTARHMTNDMRGTNNIYPHTPVMAYDNRQATSDESRYNARGDARSDDARSDRSDRLGPDMRR